MDSVNNRNIFDSGVSFPDINNVGSQVIAPGDGSSIAQASTTSNPIPADNTCLNGVFLRKNVALEAAFKAYLSEESGALEAAFETYCGYFPSSGKQVFLELFAKEFDEQYGNKFLNFSLANLYNRALERLRHCISSEYQPYRLCQSGLSQKNYFNNFKEESESKTSGFPYFFYRNLPEMKNCSSAEELLKNFEALNEKEDLNSYEPSEFKAFLVNYADWERACNKASDNHSFLRGWEGILCLKGEIGSEFPYMNPVDASLVWTKASEDNEKRLYQGTLFEAFENIKLKIVQDLFGKLEDRSSETNKYADLFDDIGSDLVKCNLPHPVLESVIRALLGKVRIEVFHNPIL